MENLKASSSQGNRAARLTNQFFKTRTCIFWERGRCTRGADCAYAHGDAELRGQPDLRMTSVCRRIMDYGHCEDANCSFAHSLEELRATSKFYKTTLCKFDALRECRLGAFCRHAHGEAELRKARLQEFQMASQAYHDDTSTGGLCSSATSSSSQRPPASAASPQLHGGSGCFAGCAPAARFPAGYPMPPPMPGEASLQEDHSATNGLYPAVHMPIATGGLPRFASSGSTGARPDLHAAQSYSSVDPIDQQNARQDVSFPYGHPGMMVLRL
eukprot:TRINITY_DN32350_c0_g1_i1.p1 TRINITY_DN32350_c0_g1~~TRINITY_DN32350_c0_g1_i1.p1  ORF type:complete len:271 (+),score=41.50 TRINITY_DN32350_c0_g1_i1:96-908(+)